jgi:hypothetical protein
MSHDAINSWVRKAKSKEFQEAVIKRGVQKKISTKNGLRGDELRSNGSFIMEIAEKIRPHLQRMFAGVRDENGMILQPAHIRGIALNVAQDIFKKTKKDK